MRPPQNKNRSTRHTKIVNNFDDYIFFLSVNDRYLNFNKLQKYGQLKNVSSKCRV